jgi:2-iminobutanoate/2-iminopropanoate deaminase
MNKRHNPKSIAAPIGTYSHGIETPPNARWLHVAGQTGLRPDGTTPEGIEAQTEAVWTSIVAILKEARMVPTDIVKINTYITRAEYFPGMAKIRAKYLGDHRPASTAIICTALARPEFIVEVEAIAAKAVAAKPAPKPAAKAKVTKRAVKKKKR